MSRLGLLCVGLGIAVALLQARELSVLWSTPQAARLRPGAPVPPLRFRAPDGKENDLVALRGSPVVVTFWASWCVPCRAEMPELAHAVEEINREGRGAGPPLRVVAINTGDEPAGADTVMRDPAYASFLFGVDADGRLAEAWGAAALPTTVLVRPDGTVEESKVGYDPYLRLGLRSWVKRTRPKEAAS